MSFSNIIIPQTKKRSPLVLIILDGWGIAPPSAGNAITQAKTPVMDYLWHNFPHTKLYSYGYHVGLPDEQVGNSEAGHLNIGAGRIVIQDSVYISKSIKDGTFFKNPAFLEALQHIKQYKSRLHIIGILSGEQCPHIALDHIIALAKFVKIHNVHCFLHFFTDGRDSPKKSALDCWKAIKDDLGENIHIATVAGRLYLDRKKNWFRTQEIYHALVLGETKYIAPDFNTAILDAYRRGETDEFISPTLIRNQYVTSRDNIEDQDSIIFYNLRSDRARQFTKPFVQNNFEADNKNSFIRRKVLRNIKFVAMTDFGPDLEVLTAYPSRDIQNTLPAVLGERFKQLYISEMEKYAHITYFFNGGYRAPIAGEHRIFIRSKDVDSYDVAPEMSALEITDVVVRILQNRLYDFICVNFPNADMLGHTGNISAVILGCEAVDKCLARLFEVVQDTGGEMIITADHGNAENMSDGNTMHEASPVPFIIYTDKKIKLKEQDSAGIGGKLGDIAPTLLQLIDMPKPDEMTGKSLIE